MPFQPKPQALIFFGFLALGGCGLHRTPGAYVDDGPMIQTTGYNAAAYRHYPAAAPSMPGPGPNLTPLLYGEPHYSPPAPSFVPYGGVAGAMPGIGANGYAR